jgi:Fe-S-cluster containining protein
MTRRAGIPIRSTEQLGRIFVKANRTQRQYLVEMLAHYQREFEQAAEALDNETGEYPNAESLAFSVHETLDDFMTTFMAQDANAQDVRCHKGCSACCHLHVTIDKHEAVLLLEHAREVGLALDLDLLRRQQGKTLRQWTRQPRADQACVFLGDTGECRVYEHRPNSCRKYHVVSPPQHCDTHKHPGHRVWMLVCPEAEVVASAALLAFPDRGSLPDLLTAALSARPAVTATTGPATAQP